MKHLFGPVPSRRLNSSLGVDLVPHKVCSFDCIYCQLGKTTKKTVARQKYVPTDEVLGEVRDFISSGQRCDYITLSGSGEPTLNSDMGQIIRGIKSYTDIPVAVLTNSSLINDEKVRQDLMHADLILPSLDAVTQKIFEKVNRPYSGIKISEIIDGLTAFTRQYTGEVWLEIMLMEGVNDGETEIESMKNVIELIHPDKVQLNTVVRPPTEDYVKSLTHKRLKDIGNILCAEVIADFSGDDRLAYAGEKEELILNLLKRRPCTINDISAALGLHENEVLKYVQHIVNKNLVAKKKTKKGLFFVGVTK